MTATRARTNAATAAQMTAADLCREISRVFTLLPVKEQRSIERCYVRTMTLVSLFENELALPTEYAHARLAEVLAACEYECGRHGIDY